MSTICIEIAQERIKNGEDPDLFVHELLDGYGDAVDLSSGITEEDLSSGGYTSEYFRLGDIAATGLDNTVREMNNRLVQHQSELRAEVEVWASGQASSLNAASARVDFESAVLEAIQGQSFWQDYTNSDLCCALGHCTLAFRVANI